MTLSTFSLKRIHAPVKNYALIVVVLVASYIFSRLTAPLLGTSAEQGQMSLLIAFFEIGIVCIGGFLVFELAKPTVIPSFVLAIFIGMIERESLSPIIQNTSILTILTTLGASFILFGGGLDTPFARFKKLVGPILSIAFVGTLITAALFSIIFTASAEWFQLSISVGAIVLLGAALSSTDPAAIIPSLKSLVFPNPRIKDIAISESAINDVVGAVLTGVFLTILTTQNVIPASIADMYGHLLNPETAIDVLYELLVGCAVGFFGFVILHFWSKWKARLGESGDADAALFLAIPVLCFLVATVLHGSGFLAVFIAGLLFQLEQHVSHVEHYFVHTIEGLMKPLIFLLLGASVDVHALMQVMVPGIVMGILFMFVIRPIAVFLSLSVFMRGKHALSVRELLFLSFVRETGVIPAVLIIGMGVSGIQGIETASLIGLWVILLTLIVEPPLTPLVARILKVAHNMPAYKKQDFTGPTAILCSRGRSFLERTDAVIEWLDLHGMTRMQVLHCPEGKFNDTELKRIRAEADTLFAAINKTRLKEHKNPIQFSFLEREGLLESNIESLVQNEQISIIFVGTKMLDYRLEDVKNLRVPFVFLS